MKRLFNFYLDDGVKESATKRIESLCGIQEKGQLASLIRVLLNEFLETNDNARLTSIASKVTEEYCLTTHCNKRSKL